MKTLRFYEGTHSYFYGKQKLTSVTTYIAKFFEEFDAKAIARKLAKFPNNKAQKKGVRYWLAEWKESGEHGTKVHQEIEDLVNAKYPLTENVEPKAHHGYCWYTKYLKSLKTPFVSPEERIFNEELGLAGTIDLMITHFVKGQMVVSLVDWKTNKKLTTKGYQGKKGTHDLTKYVDDCKVTKYSLQLALYAYMLELKGYVIKDLLIVHLTNKKAKKIVVSYPDFKPLVIQLLESVKNEN